MRRVAPDTPRIADRQSDKDARQSGEGRFALDAAVNLVDKEVPGGPMLEQGDAVGGGRVMSVLYGGREDGIRRPNLAGVPHVSPCPCDLITRIAGVCRTAGGGRQRRADPEAELDAVLGSRPPVVTPLTPRRRGHPTGSLTALIDDRLVRQFLAKNAPPVSKEDVASQVAALQRGLTAQGKPLDDYLRKTTRRRPNYGRPSRDAPVERVCRQEGDRGRAAEVFAENKDFFDKTTVRASHIVIRLSPDAPAAEREEAKKKLQAIRSGDRGEEADVRGGGDETLAVPECPEGWRPRLLRPQVDGRGAVREGGVRAQVGEISEVVTTDFGLHLITVTERKPGTPVTLDAVADEVRECLLEDLRQRTLTELRQAATVEIKLP